MMALPKWKTWHDFDVMMTLQPVPSSGFLSLDYHECSRDRKLRRVAIPDKQPARHSNITPGVQEKEK